MQGTSGMQRHQFIVSADFGRATGSTVSAQIPGVTKNIARTGNELLATSPPRLRPSDVCQLPRVETRRGWQDRRGGHLPNNCLFWLARANW